MGLLFCVIKLLLVVKQRSFHDLLNMQAGVDMVADLVGVTLGPKGRNVVLQNKYGPPKIVNDGVTVLKEVNQISTLGH